MRCRILIPRKVTKEEIIDSLEKAESLGYDLGKNSSLEKLTIRELESLVLRESPDKEKG